MATKKKPTPQDRSFSGEMQDIGKLSGEYAGSMVEAQAAANRQMIQDALAATDQIASKLNNDYTAAGRRQVDAAKDAFGNMGQYGQRLGALGGIAEGDVQGTAIEAELRRQAMQELQLGRSLSPEEERMAQQAGRAGYAARGMAVGQGSALAEVLNRDSLATARQDQRRAFAGTVNQAETQNRLSRLGMAGNLLGQAANVYQGQGQGQLGVAQGYIAVDPYQRALGSNLPGAAMGASSSLIGNAYGNVMQYGADVNNTNYNAAWSNYLNNQNQNTAMQMGQMQAGAAKSAGNQAMTGAMIGAGGAIVGGAIIF